jgi:hypothetical protein
MAFGRASVVNRTDVAKDITCGLQTPGPGVGFLSNAVDEAHIQDLGVGAEQTLSLLGPIDFSKGGGDVTLDCFTSGPDGTSGNLTFTDIQVSAIQVGSLNSPSTACTDEDGDGDASAGGVDDGDGCL